MPQHTGCGKAVPTPHRVCHIHLHPDMVMYAIVYVYVFRWADNICRHGVKIYMCRQEQLGVCVTLIADTPASSPAQDPMQILCNIVTSPWAMSRAA